MGCGRNVFSSISLYGDMRRRPFVMYIPEMTTNETDGYF
jgi:hypothetical protein